jgi:predicted lipoprotein with Yx(FWY)xxD motif
VLVGADGKTLYIFTPDADAAGKSVCNGECATAWPPLMGDAAPTVGTGLDASDFTTITRDDGTKQIAFYGQPLYYFAADAAAGDVKGQGLNEKWYVIGADGKAIK